MMITLKLALALLAQMPSTVPDLVWWLMGILVVGLQAAVLGAMRLAFLVQAERIARAERDLAELKRYVDDHLP